MVAEASGRRSINWGAAWGALVVLRLDSPIVATAAPAPIEQDENPSPWRWRGGLLGLAVVAAIGGVALRVFAPSPLWLDEALSVQVASLSFGDMVEALRHDGHPSLYYLLLGWWMDVFGDSNGAARSLSAVASLGAVPVLWAIGRRRNETVAWFAAILALTSPYLLRYGTEARMYAMLTFFVAAAWLVTEQAVDRPTFKRLALVSLATAALMHTHYWSFWLIGAALLVIVAECLRSVDRRPALVRVGVAIIAGTLTFTVWLSVFFEQLGSTGTPWADRARPAEIAIETMQALGGNNRFEGELLGVIVLFVALLGAFGWARRENETVENETVELRFGSGPLSIAAVMITVTLAIGGGIALVTAGAFEGRYAAVVVPFVLLLAARGVSVLPRHVATATLAVLALFGLAIGIDEGRRDRTQAGDVASTIDRDHGQGDIVAFCPDQVGPATHRALQADLEAVAYPRGDGTLIDWQDYADTITETSPEAFLERVAVAAAGNQVWLVVGLGYKSLGNRCEAIIEQLNRSHRPHHLVSPSEAFEPMLLTRYEPLG
jgi:mannosyltransferase